MATTRLGLVVLAVLGFVIAGLSGLTYYRYRHDLQQARDRVATGSRMVETACGAIEYAVAGDGPPVLIVHGAGGGFDQGLDFGKALIERGLRVIAMSRFGYPRTPLPTDASPAAQADAHACLLDALGIKRAAIAGASAGAPSSMQFALRHPKRITALVLLVPAAYVPRPGGAPPMAIPPGTAFLFDTALKSDFLLWAATRLARRTVIRAILATPPAVLDKASPEEQARARLVLDHILPVTQRGLGLRNDAAVIFSLPRYELERIAVSTLIVSTADDLYGTFESARYRLSQRGPPMDRASRRSIV